MPLSLPLPPPTNTPAVASNVPVRRPKHGVPPPRHFDYLHEHYYNSGRKLKFSGDARYWSTYAPTHREYRPLANPPPPNSLYHKHGGIIAKLELLDALVCFTYSLWTKDYKQKSCNRDTWKTSEGFINWCRDKWAIVDNTREEEKALFGLM